MDKAEASGVVGDSDEVYCFESQRSTPGCFNAQNRI